MDGKHCNSSRTAPVALVTKTNDIHTMEVIKSVANKLAIIGDELNHSYQKFSCSGVSLAGPNSCGQSEGWLKIALFILRASV